MVVEHTFVTTLEGPAALAAAEALVLAMEYQVVSADERSVHAARGKKRRAGVYGLGKLERAVRLEFDRGRVTVAASMAENGQVKQQQSQMLLDAARAMEMLLAEQRPLEEAVAHWRRGEETLRQRARRLSRVATIVIVTILLIGLGLAILANVL